MVGTSNRLRWRAAAEIDLREDGGASRSRTLQVLTLEDLECLREERPRLLGSPPAPGHLAGPVLEVGADERVVGELGRLLVVALRLSRRGKRGGPIAGAGEHFACLRLDLGGVRRVRRFPVSVQVVRGKDLDDLLLFR